MRQYCRYCAWMVVGDANYCSRQERTMSDGCAKSPNRYHPREPKKKQCDGQLSLF